jgi:anthranilate phosphoribosyltransferase
MKEMVGKVINGSHLTETQMIEAMETIMEGRGSDALVASFLTALRMKGETVEEITGGAKVMRAKAEKIDLGDIYAIDTCGTGGDGANTFNISTAVAFICAAAGVPVVKHGNRAVSSKSGSADVLEALGVNITLTPEQVEKCVREQNIGFLFAPTFHKAMKHAIGVRKELGFRTIFNMLGPLTNPANAKGQVLGVFNADLTDFMAEVLKNLGVERALVVYGMDGLDEITVTDRTKVTELKDGNIKSYYIEPADFGMEKMKKADIEGADSTVNADIIKSIFNGEKGAKRDIVVLNAAAALYVGRKLIQ